MDTTDRSIEAAPPQTTSTVPESLPPGYREKGFLFGGGDTDMPAWKWLLLGNLLALIPLGAAIVLIWLPYQFYAALGAPLARFAAPDWASGFALWVVGAVVIGLSMLAHEGLHGLVLLIMGHRPRLLASAGYLFATVQRGDLLTRRQYLILTLTPLIVLTLLGGAILPFLPVGFGQIVVIALLLNAAASVGDLAVASLAIKQPVDALFADWDGIRVYIKVLDENS